MKPRECRARVTAVRRLAPEVLEAELAMVEPPALDFAAGQWVSVPFGPKTVRAYSIASPPLDRRRIALCADVAPGGLGSRWFRGLAPGAEVTRDHEHDDHDWWPADVAAWPQRADEPLRRMATLLEGAAA